MKKLNVFFKEHRIVCLVLLLLSLFTILYLCLFRDRIYLRWYPGYGVQENRFDIHSEEAFSKVKSVVTGEGYLHFISPTPRLILGDYYLFGELSKGEIARINGYYVHGCSGRIEYRDSWMTPYWLFGFLKRDHIPYSAFTDIEVISEGDGRACLE